MNHPGYYVLKKKEMDKVRKYMYCSFWSHNKSRDVLTSDVLFPQSPLIGLHTVFSVVVHPDSIQDGKRNRHIYIEVFVWQNVFLHVRVSTKWLLVYISLNSLDEIVTKLMSFHSWWLPPLFHHSCETSTYTIP